MCSVVADDLGVGTVLLDARRVEAPDDRHALARTRDEERTLPGAVGVAWSSLSRTIAEPEAMAAR
jgi:hypothetical protein